MESFFSHPVLFGEDILNQLHFFSGAIPDIAMKLITNAGGIFFYVFIFSLIYWFFDRRTAIRIIVIFYISSFFNFVLKEVFATPRPDPDRLIQEVRIHNLEMKPSSPGFPSGHTQGAVSFYLPVFIFFKNRAVKITSVLLMIVIPYSRLYLGVHFAGDILGGYIAGFLIVLILMKPVLIIEKIYLRSDQKLKNIAILLFVTALFAFGIAVNNRYLWSIAGMAAGIFAGAHLYFKRGPGKMKKSILSIFCGTLIGFAGIGLGFLAGKMLHPNGVIRFIIFFASGIWITFLAPVLFKLTGIYEKE